jgi:hypothetical protein
MTMLLRHKNAEGKSRAVDDSPNHGEARSHARQSGARELAQESSLLASKEPGEDEEGAMEQEKEEEESPDLEPVEEHEEEEQDHEAKEESEDQD